MALVDLQRDIARRAWLSQTAFGEAVTYFPGGHEADPRPLRAVIDRKTPEPTGVDAGKEQEREALVLLGNDPENTPDTPNPNGWGMSDVAEGDDLIEFPVKVGGEPARWRVLEIVDQCAALWLLRVGL